MASTAGIDQHSVQAVIGKTKTLINTQLKSILRSEGLAVSGAKAVMQERIIGLLTQHAREGKVAEFNRLKDRVFGVNNSSYNSHNDTPPSAMPPQHSVPIPPARSASSFGAGMHSTSFAQMRLNFKDSPFYTIIEPLTAVLELREAARETLEAKINLRADTVDRLNGDPSLKVMIYCASDPISPFSQADIAFPHSIEIRVNLDEVKANLRGLKGKPGSTRPAEITNLLRKRAGYENTLNITYALTNKDQKFYAVVNLVKQHPAEQLVAKLKTGRSISKEQVVREMITKSQDNDIVATSSIMSLKCPLSTLRIDTPCRSTICTHNQCFDALSFLQLQEQGPTWTCPVCNKTISFQALQVDQYVNDILRSTSRSVDQVTMEPDGKWSQVVQKETPSRNNGTHSSSDDDDDLIEIQDMPRLAAIRDETLLTPSSMARTPPYSSREQSFSSAAPRSNTSGKRAIGQVIDLTFSSEDEEQPPRGPKRQSTQSSSNGPANSYTSSGTTAAQSLPRPNGVNFNLPRLAPARPPESLDYRFGS
ncbi:SUMO ligase siz1 [Lambiella insularis]|nr:SUMO ligase siz1 [Lambiella insularis]